MWRDANPEVGLARPAEAAAHGELIVNATAGAGSVAMLESAGEDNLSGKVLLDIANPLDSSKGCRPRCSSATRTRSASRSSVGSRGRAWSRR